jgi:hypothetical protein
MAAEERSTNMWRRAIGVVVLAAFVCAGRAVWADDDEHYYYYIVSEVDGSERVDQMSSDDAKKLHDALRDGYREALKEWGELRKSWFQAVGNKPFPVLRPRPPKISRKSRIPSSQQSRERVRERYQRRLEFWDVCLVAETGGQPAVEVIRRDKVYGRKQKLMQAYVAAIIPWAKARKENPEDKNEPPKAPELKVLKGAVRSAELADKYAELFNRKLQKMAEKKQEEAKE